MKIYGGQQKLVMNYIEFCCFGAINKNLKVKQVDIQRFKYNVTLV